MIARSVAAIGKSWRASRIGRNATPNARPSAGTAQRSPREPPPSRPSVRSVPVVMEHLLHSGAEKPGDADGQRQRGIVAALLDRVDRLPRDAERMAQILLRQAFGLAQGPHVVPHEWKVCFTSSGVKPALHLGPHAALGPQQVAATSWTLQDPI